MKILSETIFKNKICPIIKKWIENKRFSLRDLENLKYYKNYLPIKIEGEVAKTFLETTNKDVSIIIFWNGEYNDIDWIWSSESLKSYRLYK